MEGSDDPTRREWLPPEAAGSQSAPGEYGQQPPHGHPAPGQYGQQPPPGHQPPPSWGPPHQPYNQPTPYQPNPYAQPSPWASTYYWTQAEPDNTPGMAGFIMSLASIGTLVMFFGFLSPLNLCLSIAATFVSRSGIKKVQRGETTRNKDVAQWGFWLGIVGAVLSLLVMLAFVLLITSDPSWLDTETEPR